MLIFLPFSPCPFPTSHLLSLQVQVNIFCMFSNLYLSNIYPVSCIKARGVRLSPDLLFFWMHFSGEKEMDEIFDCPWKYRWGCCEFNLMTICGFSLFFFFSFFDESPHIFLRVFNYYLTEVYMKCTFKKGITNCLEILAWIGNSKYLFEKKLLKHLVEGKIK